MSENSPAAGATFGFVKITVRDFDSVTDFYCGLLGLTVTRTVEVADYAEVVLRPAGVAAGTALILLRHNDGRALSIGDGWGPRGFYVADADQSYALALVLGGRSSREPHDVGDLRVAYVFDPEGHEVELVARKA